MIAGVPDRAWDDFPKGLKFFNVGKGRYAIDVEGFVWWIVQNPIVIYGVEYAPGFYLRPWVVKIGKQLLSLEDIKNLA